MRVGVIDCSNEINSQTCRDYEVMAYPTVRYFPPHTSPTNIGIEFGRSFSAEVMKNYLVKKLETSQKDGLLTFLCNLQPYENSTLESDSEYMITFFIIDTPNNLLAKQLIIDFCPVKKIKIVFALNSNAALVDRLKPATFPSLYRIENNNQFELLASGNNKTHFTETINANLETINVTPFSIIDITTKLYNLLFQKSQALQNKTNTVYLSDLEATLRYSLDHEVTSRSVITADALYALNGYLELLVQCFPASIRGKKFIKLVWENMRYNTTISGQTLGETVNKYEVLLNPFVTKRKWIGCEGSKPMYRRYPCGLWTLFHTLTVQASVKNLEGFSGVQVLEIIAGYVKNFFGCTDCSKHFMEMAASIKNNVSSYDDAVLWLWSAHNQVNQRLAGDVTEDPMYPKILFPLKVHCETCHDDNSGDWNRDEVLKYLKKMYSSISIQQKPVENIKPEYQNIISSQQIIDDSNYNTIEDEEWKIDVNTCMISYILSCSVLMILFYLLVVKKRCKKNKYIYFIFGKV